MATQVYMYMDESLSGSSWRILMSWRAGAGGLQLLGLSSWRGGRPLILGGLQPRGWLASGSYLVDCWVGGDELTGSTRWAGGQELESRSCWFELVGWSVLVAAGRLVGRQ